MDSVFGFKRQSLFAPGVDAADENVEFREIVFL